MIKRLNIKNEDLEGLTKDQKRAMDFFKEFIESDTILGVLKGHPGVGKTFVLNRLCRAYKGIIGVSAPTHRAKIILESNVKLEGKTIQSFLGLRPNTDLDTFDIENMQFTLMGEPQIDGYDLLLIDEASQLNSGLLKLIDLLATQYRCKVLFIGDDKQLPPVKESVSKVFEIENSYEMTEIVRTETDNPLMDLIIAARHDVENETGEFGKLLSETRIKSNSKGKGYCLISKDKFKEEILKEYGNKDINHIRTLAYDNNCVTFWNTYLRNQILNSPKEILTYKDLLTAYNTVYKNPALPPNIINSNDYTIKGLHKTIDSKGFNIFKSDLKSCIASDSVINSKGLIIINHQDDETFAAYYDTLCRLHKDAIESNSYARKKNWTEFYKFKNKYLSLQSLELNGSKLTKDLDYGYAMTVHKSQGGTFDRVGIDLGNLKICKDKNLMRRLIYVAISRAKDVAYLTI